MLGSRVGSEFAARLDEVLVLCAIGLFIEAVGLHVAVRLRAPGSILRSNDHGDRVVDGEGNECQQDGSHEECLRRSVSLADLEDGNPQEADTGRRDSDDRGGEEEEDEQKE